MCWGQEVKWPQSDEVRTKADTRKAVFESIRKTMALVLIKRFAVAFHSSMCKFRIESGNDAFGSWATPVTGHYPCRYGRDSQQVLRLTASESSIPTPSILSFFVPFLTPTKMLFTANHTWIVAVQSCGKRLFRLAYCDVEERGRRGTYGLVRSGFCVGRKMLPS